MCSNFYLLGVVSVVQHFIPQCVSQYDWHGGDWVMENLKGTAEPIGVQGEWSDYVNTLAGEYEENPESTTAKEFVTGRNAGPPEWYPLTPKEIPYLAVLYRRDRGPSQSYRRFFELEADPGASHIEPGTACGGALLTSRYVLSVCGCFMSLISEVHGVPNPSEKDPTFEQIFDIFDRLAPDKKQIFMTHTAIQFIPDFRYEIEHDRSKWPSDGLLNCKDLLTKLDDRNWNNGIHDNGKKSELMNSHFVLVPFKPDVRPDSTKFFPKWPPRQVNDKEDPAYLQHVDVISFGMGFSKPPDVTFFSSTSASSLEMKHCNPKPTFTCNFTRIDHSHNYTCFCPTSVDYSLYGGTIGWPVVQQDELVGLTASRRDPKNGFITAAILSDEYVKLIQDYLGLNTLQEQNTPPPVYRHRDLGRKYFIYDYELSRSKNKNRFSEATTDEPKVFLISIACMSLLGSVPF